jgi:hypothetical protein
VNLAMGIQNPVKPALQADTQDLIGKDRHDLA